jgi:hypothetical protein
MLENMIGFHQLEGIIIERIGELVQVMRDIRVRNGIVIDIHKAFLLEFS